MRPRSSWILCACALIACGGNDGRVASDGPGTSGLSATTDPDVDTSTGPSGTSGPGPTSAADTIDPDGSEEGAIFDLGIVPDGGGPIDPMGGIPQTCAQAAVTQSTVGCSFHANKMQNFQEEPSSVVVGNVSDSQDASVQLYWGPSGNEQAVGAPVVVAPGASHEFVLDQPLQPGNVSVLRDGGAYRVETDVPVVAYQHSPIAAVAHNDSSVLIPDHALGEFYIVAAWGSNISGHDSAFNVVGVHDGTTVTWTPPNATSAGNGVPAVAAGASGMAVVDHYDLLQVISTIDMSGTVVETSQPAWVMGTVPCVNIPANVTFCDHIEEQLIGLEYWGTEYVGAHAPTRGSEHYWWRVYSGSDGVTITTDPPQTGTPVMLDRGEYYEFSTQESFVFTGDGPFMPVQYLEGQDGGAGTGDPASYQMVPTEQFLPRYVFVTGTGYTWNYAQIIRPLGGADVLVDGIVVDGYSSVGAFEVADWPIAEGSHLADSAEPFGVVQVGYTGVTSYAYPGGLGLGFINPDPEG